MLACRLKYWDEPETLRAYTTNVQNLQVRNCSRSSWSVVIIPTTNSEQTTTVVEMSHFHVVLAALVLSTLVLWQYKIVGWTFLHAGDRVFQPYSEARHAFEAEFRESSLLARVQPGAVLDWPFEDWLVFNGLWSPNEKAIVKNALLGAVDMLQVTMDALSGYTGESDLSFQRYFRPGDLTTVRAIFQRMLTGQ